ncbi:MAG TPA: MBL fold metallo-hydrolase [Nocardioides sp.]|nr:MBL fold metallo-hydrolase [Nocardioides sp.]
MHKQPERRPAHHPASSDGLTIQLIGGPTALITLGGLRFLTDPTFDPPGTYSVGARVLTKTAGPAIQPEGLEAVDVVLLSHDQHPDNLDHLGRSFLTGCPTVLTTPAGASRLGGGSTGMAPWETIELSRPGRLGITVTAVPALHGPEGCEPLTGAVTGFVLSGPELPTVYVSGDNASLDHVVEVAEAFPRVDVAVLFAGAARTPVIDAHLTLTSEQAVAATRVLGASRVVPVHVEGWQHFTEGPADVAESFRRAGLTEQLVPLSAGQSFSLTLPAGAR